MCFTAVLLLLATNLLSTRRPLVASTSDFRTPRSPPALFLGEEVYSFSNGDIMSEAACAPHSSCLGRRPHWHTMLRQWGFDGVTSRRILLQDNRNGRICRHAWVLRSVVPFHFFPDVLGVVVIHRRVFWLRMVLVCLISIHITREPVVRARFCFNEVQRLCVRLWHLWSPVFSSLVFCLCFNLFMELKIGRQPWTVQTCKLDPRSCI